MNRFTFILLCALAYHVPGVAQSPSAAAVDSVLKTVQLLPATVSAIQAPGTRSVSHANRRGG